MRFGRTILLTTFISILAIMAGCTQGTSEARLAQIDSLLERKLYDSARAELSRISPKRPEIRRRHCPLQPAENKPLLPKWRSVAQ